MSSPTPSNGADPQGITAIRSAPSDDSRNYEGVYYGSESSDDEDMISGPSDVAELLRQIAEPDEGEEPFDILADNGEFLYEEEDQREYRTINTAAPPLPSMDLLVADSVGSPSLASISELGEDDTEIEDSIDGNLSSVTPKRSNRRPHDQDVIFRSTTASAPISMYQMPKDYTVESSSFDSQDLTSGNDSETDSTAFSSVLSGSMKALVRDIDGVLDEMNLESSTHGEMEDDDNSIPSDASVGGTTQLSGELERAQEVFWEFTGIDARGTQKSKKIKKERNKSKKASLGSKPSASKNERSKPSTISLVLLGFCVALIGVFVATFVFVRKQNSVGIGTEASAVISPDLNIPVEPTISPGIEKNNLILARGPTLEPTKDPQIVAATSVPSLRPSLRPSDGLQVSVTLAPSSDEIDTSNLSLEPTKQVVTPVLLPISEENGISDVSYVGDADMPVHSGDGGGNSFPVPDTFVLPWDDDDIVEGQDDFYSNDDEYEYERHHPGHKTIKQGRHHGKQKIEKDYKHPKRTKQGRILESERMIQRIRGSQGSLRGV